MKLLKVYATNIVAVFRENEDQKQFLQLDSLSLKMNPSTSKRLNS